jgi:integrase
MARIQKRTRKGGQTTYVVKWRTPDGHDRTRGGFTTRRAANAYAARAEGAKLRGSDYDPAAGGITFRAAAQAWLASRHDLKPTTIAGYRYALAPAERHRPPARRLSIDATFGGYPLNRITRDDIQAWVAALLAAGKKPNTLRLSVLIVRQVLAQAVVDGRLPSNPADHVRLPSARTTGRTAGSPAIDNPEQFLTAAQVSGLAAATPWPYNVLIHVAAWSGLRAGELGGLLVGDVRLPTAPDRPGALHVTRTLAAVGGDLVYQAPKTKGSQRRVPLTAATMDLLRAYLRDHPRAADPTAPLWPAIRLGPNGSRLGTHKAAARLPVADVEARLVLDWGSPLRHTTFYQRVFQPAVVRAGLPPAVVFHSLRHTYVSLCVAAGIPPLEISRYVGHSTVTTTLSIYAHLFESDHSTAMAALGAMGAPTPDADTGTAVANGNVLPFRRGGG